MGMRRMVARRLRRTSADVWPIDPAAAKQPEGWPGWPGGKNFAVVLTHDVEGPEGLMRCRELAERERELGFRSSFNFIPEGSYKVNPDLRAWLTQNGFEVGVHDLEHDGRLFSSETEFDRKAKRINHYLRDWGAKGFRAGFMLRNLDWLHKLDIAYDCSTFDTDPFEPQPDSTSTIFPFWIPVPGADANERARGYVELPYTLPQDSTLYVVHQEGSNIIWRDKLEWVASHGGMVLLNVHPDYLHFRGRGPSPQRTVLEHYLDLLSFLQLRFPGAYWHALPHQVAAFVRSWQPTLADAAS
jgi:hypothetical protein